MKNRNKVYDSLILIMQFGIIFNLFIPTINAVIVAMLIYIILIKAVRSPKMNPFIK